MEVIRFRYFHMPLPWWGAEGEEERRRCTVQGERREKGEGKEGGEREKV